MAFFLGRVGLLARHSVIPNKNIANERSAAIIFKKLATIGELYPRIVWEGIRGAYFGNHRSQGCFSNSYGDVISVFKILNSYSLFTVRNKSLIRK